MQPAHFTHQALTLPYLLVAGKGAGGTCWIVCPGFGQQLAALAWVAAALPGCGRALIIGLPGQPALLSLAEPAAAQAINKQTKPTKQKALPSFTAHADAQPAPPTALHLATWLQALLAQEGLAGQKDKVCVLGYSIGGRMALGLLAAMPGRLTQVVLVAAEGCGPSRLFALATATGLGRRVFARFMQGSGLARAVAFGVRFSLMRRSLAQYLGTLATSPASRTTLVHTWLALRLLPGTAPAALAAIASAKTITLHLFAGKADRLVPPARMAPLANAYTSTSLTVLPAGHNCLPQALKLFVR